SDCLVAGKRHWHTGSALSPRPINNQPGSPPNSTHFSPSHLQPTVLLLGRSLAPFTVANSAGASLSLSHTEFIGEQLEAVTNEQHQLKQHLHNCNFPPVLELYRGIVFWPSRFAFTSTSSSFVRCFI